MKKTLRILTLLTIVALISVCIVSCADTDDSDVRVYLLKGPTGVGAVNLFEGHDNYKITVVDSPDVVSAAVIKGEYDIAALPINLAAVLYSKTNKELNIAALNTLSVLYIMEAGDTINSLADLEGKTIYATGQGSTPEYIITALLDAAGVNCEVEYSTDGSALAATMTTGDNKICLLPQPAATVANVNGARVALDIADEWAKYFDTEIIQGCVVVRKGFAQEHPALVKQFLKDYKESTGSVNTNVDEAAALCETHGLIPKAALAKKAIPLCNIVYIDGNEMQERAQAFFTFLYEKNPASVGGAIPDEGIYAK